MSIEELKVAYYNEALALAQRALVSGLIVCAVAYSMVISKEGKTNYTIPFFNIELSSERTFTIALLVLFFIFGLICSYGIQKANRIRQSVADKQIALFLLESPNILYSNLYIRATLYGTVFSAGAGLIKSLTGLDTWAVYLSGSILAGPYFFALYSSNPNNRKMNNEDHS
ncbi:hypothetical protein ACIP01_18885 [Pseudomonas monteilii]|uniref:hypothetical protein n=1 Tax=Pseudomonas monteilii TaxID=76759 RepID=UPI0037FFBFCF